MPISTQRDFNFTGIFLILSKIIYGNVEFLTHLKIEIIYSQTKIIEFPTNIVEEYHRLYSSRFINYDYHFRQQTFQPNIIPGEMLIISHGAFIDEMSSFIDWKNQKGIKTSIINVDDIVNDSIQIKQYIQNTYNNSNLTWVLLVGDINEITTFRHDYPSTVVGHVADNKYTFLNGNDTYPDILIGRFSAEELSHVTTQTIRTLYYEKDLNETDWINKALFTGMRVTDKYDNYYEGLPDSLLAHDYISVDTFYDHNVIPDNPAEDAILTVNITNAINNGRGFIYYSDGHGTSLGWKNPDYLINNIINLTNDWKLPFIFGSGCNSGDFEDSFNFGESWLRATNDETGFPTGAIAVSMPSANVTQDGPSSEIAIKALINKKITSFGALTELTICNTNDHGLAQNSNTNNLIVNIILGDPSLQVRTDIPHDLIVNHPNLHPSCFSNTYTR